MKKYLPYIILASLALLLYFGFKQFGPKDKKSTIKPVVSMSGGKTTVKWDKTEGVDSVAIKWLDAGGLQLGRIVTTGNQVTLSQAFPNQMVTLVASTFSDGEEYESMSSTATFYSETAVSARADSVGTVDIIIQKVSTATGGGAPTNICATCSTPQTPEEFCDGTWLDTGTPASDEYYRVTAQGRAADETPRSVVFLLRITAAGDAQYLSADVAIPCITLARANVTEASRVTLYDDGTLAFEMHSTESTDATPARGVLLRSLKNVDAFEIEKVWPCPPR